MRKTFIILVIGLFVYISFSRVDAQTFAVKANTFSWLLGTFNVGGEVRCGEYYSCELEVDYNPWVFGGNKKMKHVLIQPKFKRWFRGVYDGSFAGVQMHYGVFNVAGMPFFQELKSHRYQGDLVGGSLTYGYHWLISATWSVEVSFAVGYVHLNYKRYGPEKGDFLQDKRRENYWGPTRLGFSFVYFI